MFCQNCGAAMPENSAFCPECGAKTQTFEQSVPIPTPVPIGVTVQEEPGKKPAKKSAKKGSGKKSPIKIIIALVLVAALVVCGIIFVPKLLKGGKIDVKDNAFAAKAEDVGKDADSYDALNLLAYAHNTIFNSESFTFSVADMAKGKIVFGKDIPSTEFCFSVADEDIYAAMFDGTFLATDGYDSVRVNVADIVGNVDEIKDWYLGEYEKALEKYGEEGVAAVPAYIGENLNDLVSKALSTIKDKHLNFETVKVAWNYFCELMITSIAGRYGATSDAFLHSMGTDSMDSILFDSLYDMLLDYIGGLSSDVLSVKKSSDGGKDVYSFSFDLGKLVNSLLEYLDAAGNDGRPIAAMLGDLRGDLDYYYGEEISGKVEIDGNYVSSVKINIDGETLKIGISDVNSTKISKDDYKKVENHTDDTEIIKIEDASDVIDFLDENM